MFESVEQDGNEIGSECNSKKNKHSFSQSLLLLELEVFSVLLGKNFVLFSKHKPYSYVAVRKKTRIAAEFHQI